MARTVVTKAGDIVDQLTLAAYGRTAATTEAVLDANPQLAGLGPVLPRGVLVLLPDLVLPQTAAEVKLWD